MDHEYFRDRISAFKDDGLSAEDHHLVESHLRECVECRSLLEQLESLDRLVVKESQLESDEYFEDLANRIDKRIAREAAEVTDISSGNRRGIFWKIAATAASVALLVFIGYHKDDILPPSPVGQGLMDTPSRSLAVDSLAAERDSLPGDADHLPTKIEDPPVRNGSLQAGRANESMETLDSPQSNYGKEAAFRGDVSKSGGGNEEAVEGRRKVRKVANGDLKETASVSVKPSPKAESPETVTPEHEYEMSDEAVREKSSRNRVQASRVDVSNGFPPKKIVSDSPDSNYKSFYQTEADKEAVRESLANGYVFSDTEKLTQLRSMRDSLLSFLPQYHSLLRRENKKEESIWDKIMPSDTRNVSDSGRETHLFDVLRAIMESSDDKSETEEALKIIGEMAKTGGRDIRSRAISYVDSVKSARRKKGK